MAKTILRRDNHHFDGHDLNVRIYRQELGLIPENYDTSQPSVHIPSGVVLTDIDPHKMFFLNAIPNVLGKLHAKIDWESSSDTELHVLCTLSDYEKEAAKDWVNNVKESIQFLFSTIKVRKRQCLPKSWPKVRQKISKIRQQNRTVAIVERDCEFVVYVVGRAETMKKVYNQVDKMFNEIEQSLEYMKDSIDLKTFEKTLFQKIGMASKLQMIYPKVALNLKDESLEVEGPPNDLLGIQREMNSFLTNIMTWRLNLSRGKIKVLTMLQQRPNHPFHSNLKNLQTVIVSERDGVIVAGTKNDLVTCSKDVLSNIKETTFEVSQQESTAFGEYTWQKFSSSLILKYNGILHVQLSPDKSQVNLVAFDSDFNGALEEVKSYITKATVKEETVDIDESHTRMLLQWMDEDLKKIEKDFERYRVNIDSSSNTGLIIRGTEEGLAAVKIRIQRLVSKIIVGSHTVTTPGMPQYFTQEKMGKYFITSQENKHYVVIHPKESNTATKTAIKTVPVNKPKSTAEVVKQVTHTCGVVIKVMVGDITLHSVDAIVNAANGNLSHVSGLAKAIVDEGESRKFVSNYVDLITITVTHTKIKVKYLSIQVGNG